MTDGGIDEAMGRVAAAAARYMAAPRGERRQAAVDYLFEVGDALARYAGHEEITAPLFDVIPHLADPAGAAHFEDRRTADAVPSLDLLARVTATLDILIDSGTPPEQAAQHVSRQMVRARASLPSEGGDARGWRRLLWWRERLITLHKPEEAHRAYVEVKRALAGRPSLRAAALDGSLWDRRNEA